MRNLNSTPIKNYSAIKIDSIRGRVAKSKNNILVYLTVSSVKRWQHQK
jgi:hypothetical protein